MNPDRKPIPTPMPSATVAGASKPRRRLIRSRKIAATPAGRPDFEANRLKELWFTLTDDERNEWLQLFISRASYEQIYTRLRENLGVHLKYDVQIIRFRDWVMRQEKLYNVAEALQQYREACVKNGLVGEALRAALLTYMKEQAAACADYKLGATAINLDLKAEKLALDRRKLALKERKAARDARAQAALARPKKSKGGLTAKTIRKIEAELNLL